MKRSRATWLSLVLLLLALTGCDDTITPISGDVDGNFTLNGYLDVDADTQFVRVTPVRFQFEQVDATPLDARVFTRDLNTGQEVVWQDSLVRLDDGRLDHLFFSTAPVASGITYEFVVAPPDALPTSTRILVPPTGPVRPGAFGTRATAVETVFVQDIALERVDEAPDGLDLIYRYVDPTSQQPDSLRITYAFSTDENSQWKGTLSGRDWTFPVRLTNDRYALLNHLERPSSDSTVVLLGVTAEIVRLSPNWRANIPRSIVINGYGFIGARTRYQHTWQLSPGRLQQIGYAAPER
ncbi:MAG: hypothetical protein AAF730_00430 [Bacteroidota bacterium]